MIAPMLQPYQVILVLFETHATAKIMKLSVNSWKKRPFSCCFRIISQFGVRLNPFRDLPYIRPHATAVSSHFGSSWNPCHSQNNETERQKCQFWGKKDIFLIFRIITQLCAVHILSNFTEICIFVLDSMIWNIKTISHREHPHNFLNFLLKISIFWKIGQLWPRFYPWRSRDSGNLTGSIRKLQLFPCLKIQTDLNLIP